MTTPITKEVAALLRRRREELGKSQSEVARAVGMSQASVQKIEIGEAKQSNFIQAMCDYLGVSLERQPPRPYTPADYRDDSKTIHRIVETKARRSTGRAPDSSEETRDNEGQGDVSTAETENDARVQEEVQSALTTFRYTVERAMKEKFLRAVDVLFSVVRRTNGGQRLISLKIVRRDGSVLNVTFDRMLAVAAHRQLGLALAELDSQER